MLWHAHITVMCLYVSANKSHTHTRTTATIWRASPDVFKNRSTAVNLTLQPFSTTYVPQLWPFSHTLNTVFSCKYRRIHKTTAEASLKEILSLIILAGVQTRNSTALTNVFGAASVNDPQNPLSVPWVWRFISTEVYPSMCRR